MTPETPYDVIVIGGGPAGLMAAAAALAQHARVLLVEKGDRLGRKLIISGGGRCNVTNNKPVEELVAHIPGNGKFLFSAFHQFGPREIIRFFEGLGVALKEEDNGRMFPVTDKATTVAETLIGHLRERGLALRLNAPVAGLWIEQERLMGIRLATGEAIASTSVIVAVGGMSVPKTGSTGDGYPWATEAGHSITWLFPTEVPTTSNTAWVRDRRLQGLSLQGVDLNLFDGRGKKLCTQSGDMLFTHFGVSGPAGLRLGHYVQTAMRKRAGEPVVLEVDLRPKQTIEEVFQGLLALAAAEPKKALKNVLKGQLAERLIPLLLELADLDGDTTFAHLPKAKLQALAKGIKRFTLDVSGTLSIAEAFVTGGGVDTKELDGKTMASKRLAGLYFAGEIVDVHAHTGGYNITIAFATGHAAGTAAAKWAKAEVVRGAIAAYEAQASP